MFVDTYPLVEEFQTSIDIFFFFFPGLCKKCQGGQFTSYTGVYNGFFYSMGNWCVLVYLSIFLQSFKVRSH